MARTDFEILLVFSILLYIFEFKGSYLMLTLDESEKIQSFEEFFGSGF